MRWRWGLVVLAMAAGCQGPRPADPQLVVGALRHGLGPFLDAHRLAAATAIRADLVERTAGASVHVVQVRGAERPHRHVAHDLVVTVVRGRGILSLGDERIPLEAGDTVLVPRGVPHWFASDPGTVAVALVTFAPPLDLPDVQPPDTDVDSLAGHR